MGDHIDYLGRRAYLNTVSRHQSREQLSPVMKYDLSFESLADLELLLGMMPTDILFVGGKSMAAERFRREILEKTHRIYLTRDGRLFDPASQ